MLPLSRATSNRLGSETAFKRLAELFQTLRNWTAILEGLHVQSAGPPPLPKAKARKRKIAPRRGAKAAGGGA
jgi:hypothetical protein